MSPYTQLNVGVVVTSECAICGKETTELRSCLECGRLVCGLCYVEAVDMCKDCEETWETEEDLDFI